jgi:hypothetical protein
LAVSGYLTTYAGVRFPGADVSTYPYFSSLFEIIPLTDVHCKSFNRTFQLVSPPFNG